jgi:hypothetical protein
MTTKRKTGITGMSASMRRRQALQKRPTCVFCKRDEGVSFDIFNPKFKPFGTACVECERDPKNTEVPVDG